ncbi:MULTISPECIES: heme/hemin ABC transporter substrate-binding protein [Aeromonas]|uniref:ABC transporter substrate-binding protein n=1 Tax=Aeromonas caviae TaxID=648 RepID=A0A443WHZ2_AERCA|nr:MULTISPECIES: ABC transporter substrate-binding protein [Aeromonas]MBP8281227.1 ABC transporter substrate-binding protein [Aeromonas sp.]AUV13823.1 hemin ABC transporter substrate-binding protein [Aeromonas sp. ASNIH3]AUY09108.1 hemin ABC transporter substrate-binding protein [Aeromonas sp. ASNIH2]AUZ78663.1 hemin ABC transporter substrate-binding protein [Aeromonas sp. ASNIH1]MBL0485873.1 ABC transporter substrate-binding protein [Aeromonas caviae]
MGRRFALAFSLLGCALSLSSPSVMAGERIVSIGPATTELILALGGEQSLVATDVSSPEPRGVPKVGYHRALAAEGILSLSPTLVVGSDEMGPNSTLDQLRRANVKVEVMATAPTLANLNERIDTLAHLLGDQAAGSKLKEEIAAQSDTLAAQAKQNKPLKVAFLLLHKGQPTSIAGGNTTASALVTLAGGVNPVAGLHDYKPVSTESLIELQPDLVLVSGRDWQQYQDPDAVLSQVPALSATPAGKNKAIHAIDGHALQGGLSLRSLQQANQIAQWIKQGS